MSEPMSSLEIEDVLSSIRRLVSEELRPVQRAVPPTGGAAAAGRLLLTPALRVVSGRAGPEPQPRLQVAEAESDSALEALLGQLGGGATSADEPVALPDPAEDAARAEGGAASSVEALFAAMGKRIPDTGFEPEAEDGILRLTDPLSGQDAAAFDDLAVEAAMAETAGPGWPQPELVEVDLDQVDEAEVIETEGAVGGELGAGDPLRLAEAWRDGAWPLEAARSAPKEAPAAPSAPLDADQAEAAAVAEILAAEDAAEDEPAPAADVLGEEDFLIDEEVMRALVRDIIREELQGALGERITRNVRKLVRAEINRTLLTRDQG